VDVPTIDQLMKNLFCLAMQNGLLDLLQLWVLVRGTHFRQFKAIFFFSSHCNRIQIENHHMGSYPPNFRVCSGLSAAYRLRSEGVAVTVFETQDSVGGKIQSYSGDGLIWEKGPNTMVW
jgi:hypothetical protein